MPRFNGSGPNGEGPKTGRGQGRCNSANRGGMGNVQNQDLSKDTQGGFAGRSGGRGMGFKCGYGLRRGMGMRFRGNG